MVQPTPLHHVNGGEPRAIQCSHCGTYLGRERAVTTTAEGVKFFCKQEPGDNAADSCFLQWAQFHPHLLIRRH